MGEPEAWAAIRAGAVEIEGVEFKVTKEPHGWCTGCYYHRPDDNPWYCPGLAMKICTTGGHILVRQS